MLNKRCSFIFVFIGWLLLSPLQASQPLTIPVIDNLQVYSRQAENLNVPMLILFSMESCAFCELIREEYLQPLQAREENSKQVLIGEISIESYNYIRDFDGKLVTADNIGMHYSADFSPTLVFIDPQGNELVERMVGFKGRDYYDLALDNAIQQSIEKLSR